MKLNQTRALLVGCTPPPVPTGLQGPEALAELVVASRKFQTEWTGPISDDGVRSLLKFVFFASLMPEEGAFPRYKLVCERSADSLFLVTSLDSILLDGVNQLRRLAPAFKHPECALLVAEREGMLWCDGLINVGGLGARPGSGFPGVIGVGRPPRLRLDVFGPGHLRVHETCFGGYEFRAGHLRALSVFSGPTPVKQLLDGLQARISREVLSQLGQEALNGDLRVNESHSSLHWLARLLRTAVDAQHGGAFVFLPDEKCDPSKYGIQIPYSTTHLDIGADLIENWVAYLKYLQRLNTSDGEAAKQYSEVRRDKLLTNIEAIGHFSSVDGCVVLTRGFKVLGFGAKIDAAVSQAESSPRRFKHIGSGEVYDDKTFMAAIGGTRHQSVSRLCQIHPGVLAFTVSQDGDLKLFASDEQFAYAYGPLDLPVTEHTDTV